MLLLYPDLLDRISQISHQASSSHFFATAPPTAWARIQEVRAYALVTAEALEEAIEVFLRREDADAFLAECLEDELPPGFGELAEALRESF